MTATATKTNVSAAAVRAWFRASEARVGRLSEAAAATVAEGARGKIHPEAVAEHNKRRRGHNYSAAVSGQARNEGKVAAAARRAALVEAGFEVGARGRLSAEAQAHLDKQNA